jgi:hypothetical protein
MFERILPVKPRIKRTMNEDCIGYSSAARREPNCNAGKGPNAMHDHRVESSGVI